MSSAGGGDVLFSLSADPENVLSALVAIVAGLDGVNASLDSISGGSSLGDIESALSGIGGMADDVAGGLGNLADAENAARDGAFNLGEGLSSLMEGLTGVIERAGEMAGAFIEFQAIGDLINTVHNFVSSMFDMNSSFQKLNVTLTNFVGAQQAADITGWAKSFAATVPFTTEAVQQAVVAVTALGDNAEQVVPALVTVASQMGQTLPTATQALQDAQNGLWRMMERDLHVTKDSLVAFGLQLDAHGHVLNDSLIPAFEKFAAIRFPTATSDYMHTLAGETAELNDKLQLLAATAGQPLFDEFQQAAGAVLDWLNTHQDDVNRFATVVGQDLATGFKDLGSAVQFAWSFLQDVYNIANGLVSGSFTVLTNLVHTGAQWWHDLSGGVQTVVTPIDDVAGSTGKLAGNLSHIPEMLQQFTTRTQELAGPLTPVKQMLDGLGQDLQNIVQWFTPIPGKTQEVTEKVKEWVDTGDGMGKWVSVTKQVNEVTPGKDSPFVQWLQSIGDAFSAAFGDDSKHTKVQELAQALKDFVQAIGELASKDGQQATQIIEGLAGAIGGAAGKLADFFGELQKHKQDLTFFENTLEVLQDLLIAKLAVSALSFAAGPLGALAKGALGAYSGFAKLVGQQADWLDKQEAALDPTEQAGEAVQQTGEEAQTTAEQIQALGTQVQTTGERFDTFPEALTLAGEALQAFADGPVNQARISLLQLQEQKDSLGQDFAGRFKVR